MRKLFFIVIGTLAQACTYNDLGYAPCSCAAPVTRSFSSIPSLVVNTADGFLFLNISEGYNTICNDVESSLLKDGQLISASGRMKTKCALDDNLFKGIQKSYVILDAWTILSDTVFNSTDRIHIIKSENYGYPSGFGFEIRSIKINITQPTIPTIGGYKVFKTPTDAMKVAMLILYKLYLTPGEPLTPEDLVFLKIDMS